MRPIFKRKFSVALILLSVLLLSIVGLSLNPVAQVNASDLDTIAPTVSISSPTNGSQVGGVQTITVNETDDVGVVKVDFFLDGQLLGSSFSAPFSCTWDASSVTLGSHTLTANAYDDAGNVGTSDPVTLTVVDMPVATITSPTEGQYLTGSINIAGTATASSFDNYKLEYASQTTPTTWSLTTSSTTQVTSGTLGTWNTSAVVDDVYNLRLSVTDTAGLVSTVAVNGVIVDNTLPSASISNPAANTSVNGVVNITGTASDSNFNFAKVECGAGSSPTSWTQLAILTVPVSNGTLATWDSTKIVDGTYTLRVTVTDKADNTISYEINFKVQNMHSGTASYDYDSLNRLDKVTYPSGETINYTYDATGNLLNVTRTMP
jgi:YD repeat-containing protein